MRRRLIRRGITDESGVTMIIISGGFVALMAVSAFVIDLGMVRMHRSQARTVVDAAATAASLDVGEGNGLSGCNTAIGYVQLNLGKSFAGIDCTTLTTSCTSTSTATTTSATDDDWQLTITYPVPDGHVLMTSSAIGATTQAVVYTDGLRCERIGVELERTHQSLFAGVLGLKQQITAVHAVAVTRAASNADTAVNLVILERYDCDALVAEGSGGGLGGIWVDVVINPDGSISQGYATVDSDGTGAGCGGDGVLDVDGSEAIIRADGPAGCPQEAGTHIGPGGALVGEGCGVIQVIAPGTPGCNPLACTSTGTVLPDPTALGRRVTRAPIDHRYNCKPSYTMPAGWEIRGCPDTPAPHIDNLVAALGGSGAPPGYKVWQGLGHKCTVEGPEGTVIPVNGDVYVDCPVFTVKRGVHLTGGNVVFAGDVILESSGFLAINGENGGDPLTAGLDEVTVYIRGDVFRKAGTASFIAHNAMVYMGTGMAFEMKGGVGKLRWTAPQTGKFAHLALWSESAKNHKFAGQAVLVLEGVFFTPLAKVEYKGTGAQHQTKAQFVTRKLKVSGEGVLIVRPNYDSVVLIPDDIIALIR